MANEEATTPASILTVAGAPHWHCGRTVSGYMLHTILALMPAAVMAVGYYGIDALRVMALSCSTAVVVEMLCLRAMEREVTVDDYSAVLSGLLFAFLLPASAPWWLVIIGSAVSIALGKMLFGGLGGNPLCAPLVGWAVCRISWINHMDIDASMLNTEMVNPLSQLKYFGLAAASQFSYSDLFFGNQLGALGSVQIVGLLIGGAYLLARRQIRYQIPAAFIAGLLVTALIYYWIDSAVYAPPLFHLLTGSVILGAFFLATDSATSPVGNTAMIIFGLLAGSLVIIVRVYGAYPDGVPFAILLANLLMPLLDRIRPKPFGAR
ncbi:MAG: RnfABCDGE type electron transport complex subunit D [Thermodesulfobacteriota bacterium]|nr:RnfABCDGE type electron transport complex subunit D [Thermodesulfobacteriota bacterium]